MVYRKHNLIIPLSSIGIDSKDLISSIFMIIKNYRMLNYEICKSLKDAGFPQKLEDLLNEIEYQGVTYQKPTEPTLSELIQECGNEPKGIYFRWLKNEKTQWHAQARRHPSSLGDVRAKGSTPEEAVALLYLKLYEK